MHLQAQQEHRAQVKEFQRKYRLGVVTLLFTDLVDSTRMKQDLGDFDGLALIESHHHLVCQTLAQFTEGEEIGTEEDSFFLVFAKPSEAVRYALLLQAGNRVLCRDGQWPILDRIGIHVGEVIISGGLEGGDCRDVFGIQVDTCARIMSLAEGNKILMSKFVFDNARQVLKGRELSGLGPLSWVNHGDPLNLSAAMKQPSAFYDVAAVISIDAVNGRFSPIRLRYFSGTTVIDGHSMRWIAASTARR